MADRILIVDDEPFILRSLSFVFRREGFEVFEARDGVEGMEMIRSVRPDLVYLDLMMPRKDGYAVCREVRSDPELQGTFIIILTAKGQESDRDRGLEAGADEYMTKPFSPSRIVQRTQTILRGRRAAAGES